MTAQPSSFDELQFRLVATLLRRWPLIVAAGMIGAVAGLGISVLRTPKYQASSVLGVNINYGITKSLELVVEDRVLGRVAAILVADSTLEEVWNSLPANLAQQRGWDGPADLRTELALDRRLADWHLVATDSDPVTAAQLAQAWATASINQLDEAMLHAWRAAALVTSPFNVGCEVNRDEAIPVWSCRVLDGKLDPASLAGELQTESELSRGIPPVLSYELLQSATVPDTPVIWGRSALVLAGASIGFLAALICVIVSSGALKQS